MKKAFLAGALLLSVFAFLPLAAHSAERFGVVVSGTADQESVPDYSSWALGNQSWVPVEVSGLNFPMRLLILRNIYVEDVNNSKSRYVEVFVVLGNAVVRHVANSDHFQMLVNGVWQNAASEAQPKVFLVIGFKNDFWPFAGTEVKDVRLEMPVADGKGVLKLEVAPAVGNKAVAK